MNLSLYQIGNEYQQLLDQLYDWETGEVNQEIQARIDALEPMGEKKAIAISSFIKNMEAASKEIEDARKLMAKRQERIDKQVASLKNYLMFNMKRCNITEISCPYFKIKIKKNPYSTEVFDESQVPDEYKCKVIKEVITVAKNKVKEDFVNNGVIVPGTKVERKEKLEISLDKI